MPSFTVEVPTGFTTSQFCDQDGQPEFFTRQNRKLVHFAEHLRMAYEVLGNGVLLLMKQRHGHIDKASEFDYYAPGAWLRVYDGAPRFDDDSN